MGSALFPLLPPRGTTCAPSQLQDALLLPDPWRKRFLVSPLQLPRDTEPAGTAEHPCPTPPGLQFAIQTQKATLLPTPKKKKKTRNKQLLGTRKPLAGLSTCAAQGMVWLFAPQRKLQLRRLAHKAGNCKSLLLPGAGGVPRVPESGRALQGPWARGKAAGLRFRETGTQGQGKNRGEERESAEQREHRDAWGGRAGTKGWGGPRHPLPLQVGRAGWKPKGSSLASPGWR